MCLGLQPHQNRVVVERMELHERLRKLREFMGSEHFMVVHERERDLLTNQAEYMQGYLTALDERIAHWIVGHGH